MMCLPCNDRKYGSRVVGSSVAELGPGESIGVGLAALLSGLAPNVVLDDYQFPGYIVRKK